MTEIAQRPEPRAVTAVPLALPVSRRRVIIASFWASIGAVMAGGIATVVNMLYPRNVSGFGGPVSVPANAIPAPGEPPRSVMEGRFWLVNLAPGEGQMIGDDASTSGGLLALYKKCPHLGCSVPWRNETKIPEDRDRTGWFICPCHASTYTRAGIRVKGPAPRSMDTMAISVLDTGDIVVQTGSITHGALDNTQRAVPYRPTPS